MLIRGNLLNRIKTRNMPKITERLSIAKDILTAKPGDVYVFGRKYDGLKSLESIFNQIVEGKGGSHVGVVAPDGKLLEDLGDGVNKVREIDLEQRIKDYHGNVTHFVLSNKNSKLFNTPLNLNLVKEFENRNINADYSYKEKWKIVLYKLTHFYKGSKNSELKNYCCSQFLGHLFIALKLLSEKEEKPNLMSALKHKLMSTFKLTKKVNPVTEKVNSAVETVKHVADVVKPVAKQVKPVEGVVNPDAQKVYPNIMTPGDVIMLKDFYSKIIQIEK